LTLATRPKFRDLVDRETQKPATLPALPWRLFYCACTFSKCKPQAGVGKLSDSVVSGAIPSSKAPKSKISATKILEAVRQHALEKQATLASDPVSRLQLRYTLARLYESRKDFAARAEKCGISLSRQSEVLGVVRPRRISTGA